MTYQYQGGCNNILVYLWLHLVVTINISLVSCHFFDLIYLTHEGCLECLSASQSLPQMGTFIFNDVSLDLLTDLSLVASSVILKHAMRPGFRF